MDPGMNQLLKWSIENSEDAKSDPTSTTDPKAERPSGRSVNAEALHALMGGPSDADLMRESMAAILRSDITLENKLVAFDNFEQLIENIDNANNMENIGLWTPLVSLLANDEPEIRRYAAWCFGTAVQNNEKCQARLLAVDAIPKLINLALGDSNEGVRRKAIYALSSEVRNYQPGLDATVPALPKTIVPEGAIDSGNMDAIDQIMERMREESSIKAARDH
ncbi:MAG: hsp70 nucleotide exchange factor fes1 [Ramalina farinacea]|uniref:Hsp70 nucleotide exchange factor fes1 n=1 Tax=Ramalina farinacea TaxID=258253 RepID=A0AA43TU98_9LECA|nr:hsp70 nucleotide exchange factor fes1 [Ramalina farinacea]